jgi:hypothetical protein
MSSKGALHHTLGRCSNALLLQLPRVMSSDGSLRLAMLMALDPGWWQVLGGDW